MANPFDEVINVKEEKRGEKEQHASPKRSSGDVVQVSFSLNKRMIERFVYLAIILVLLGLLFIKPFKVGVEPSPVEEAEAATGGNATVTITTAEEEAPVEAEGAEENATSVNETPEEAPTFEKDFTFTITDVDYLVVDGKPLKMDSITYKMVNNWKDLTPLVKVYWYDGTSSEETENRLRATSTPTRLSKGSTKSVTIDEFAYGLMEGGETREIIKVQLYDRETDELLKEVIKIVP